MLTIFSTPKPFIGHINIIQRNALESWKRMGPEVEVILFGDEEGAAQAARDIGIRHEPDAHRTPSGAKSLPGLFGHAEQIASNDLLCYVNCDIILPHAFLEAVKQAASLNKPFLMVGQRWDTPITEPLDFSQPDWEERVLALARAKGKPMGVWFADYFCYTRGLCKDLPPLVIGRWYWDPWLVWKARTTPGAVVVDGSRAVTAIHQNHDYGYHPAGFKGVEGDADARRNKEIAGDGRRMYPRYFATYRATPGGIRRSWSATSPIPQIRLFGPMIAKKAWRNYVWFPVLALTRPLRRLFGLNEEWRKRVAARLGSDRGDSSASDRRFS